MKTKLTSKRWHKRNGHPSFYIGQQVRNNKLPFHGELDMDRVCDSTKKAKSHQLPYPVSSIVSTAPLELVFSGVWGRLVSLLAGMHIMSAVWMILASLH